MMKRKLGIVCILLLLLFGCSKDIKNMNSNNQFEVDIIEEKSSQADFEKETAQNMQQDQEATRDKFSEKTGEKFYYNTLSDDLKNVYAELYNAVTTFEKDKLVSTLLSEDVDFVFRCVMNDSPELFYVSGYTCTKHMVGKELKSLTINTKYTMEQEEIVVYQDKIDVYAKKCFARMNEELTDYEKIQYIYNYVIKNTEYDMEAENNQNICSVFVSNKSVCQGYAKATQYLLSRLGFEVTVVSGIVNEETPHVWNLIKLEDQYYYMDPTWGDADYQFVAKEEKVSAIVMPINYDFFLITTRELEKTHQINSLVKLPECNAVKANYYRKTGTYFTKLNKTQLQFVFERAYRNKTDSVTIKCESRSVYERMQEFLIKEQNVFRYIKCKDSIAYVDNDRMYTLCFWIY